MNLGGIMDSVKTQAPDVKLMSGAPDAARQFVLLVDDFAEQALTSQRND